MRHTMPALPAMRNSIYSSQIAETAWRKSRAEQDWDGSEFFPELLACVKRLTLQRDVFQASPHELSATVFDSL